VLIEFVVIKDFYQFQDCPFNLCALFRTLSALDRRLATFSIGQRVVNACGALKFLLEQMSAGQM
jgi:hypothetical protein